MSSTLNRRDFLKTSAAALSIGLGMAQRYTAGRQS